MMGRGSHVPQVSSLVSQFDQLISLTVCSVMYRWFDRLFDVHSFSARLAQDIHSRTDLIDAQPFVVEFAAGEHHFSFYLFKILF